jgi:hypothetical protein
VPADEFSKYYASLSDEGLLEINRDDLTEVARACYDQELASRGIEAETPPAEIIEPMNDDIEWVPLGSFDLEEIELAQALLHAEEIPTDTEPPPTANYPPLTGGLELFVPEAFAARAREILASQISEEELIAEAEAETPPEDA